MMGGLGVVCRHMEVMAALPGLGLGEEPEGTVSPICQLVFLGGHPLERSWDLASPSCLALRLLREVTQHLGFSRSCCPGLDRCLCSLRVGTPWAWELLCPEVLRPVRPSSPRALALPAAAGFGVLWGLSGLRQEGSEELGPHCICALVPSADGLRQKLQDAHLASTPVFALFIQVSTGSSLELCFSGSFEVCSEFTFLKVQLSRVVSPQGCSVPLPSYHQQPNPVLGRQGPGVHMAAEGDKKTGSWGADVTRPLESWQGRQPKDPSPGCSIHEVVPASRGCPRSSQRPWGCASAPREQRWPGLASCQACVVCVPQLFQIDTAGCMEVVRERKAQSPTRLQAGTGDPPPRPLQVREWVPGWAVWQLSGQGVRRHQLGPEAGVP